MKHEPAAHLKPSKPAKVVAPAKNTPVTDPVPAVSHTEPKPAADFQVPAFDHSEPRANKAKPAFDNRSEYNWNAVEANKPYNDNAANNLVGDPVIGVNTNAFGQLVNPAYDAAGVLLADPQHHLSASANPFYNANYDPRFDNNNNVGFNRIHDANIRVDNNNNVRFGSNNNARYDNVAYNNITADANVANRVANDNVGFDNVGNRVDNAVYADNRANIVGYDIASTPNNELAQKPILKFDTDGHPIDKAKFEADLKRWQETEDRPLSANDTNEAGIPLYHPIEPNKGGNNRFDDDEVVFDKDGYKVKKVN